MARTTKTNAASERLSQKKDKLDWAIFNLLENLFVFCIMTERRVPKESGNRFGVSVTGDTPICLLVQIDRPSDPLILGQIPRPDYLCVFISGGECLCTIIEMKGTTEKGLKHGVEQIRQLKGILTEEAKRHLPTKMKFSIQGILLTPYNSDIPRKLIEREESQGLVILPLQYDHQAELFDYVSKRNRLTDKSKLTRYKHNASLRDRTLGTVETILSERTLPDRLRDSLYSKYFSPEKNRQGLYVNFAPLGDEEYTVLVMDNSRSIIAVRGKNEDTLERIKRELTDAGITSGIDYLSFQE